MTFKTNYNVGDRVYIYTKAGLQFHQIARILVDINKDNTYEVRYAFGENVGFYSSEWYTEADIVCKDYKAAVTRLKENQNQLVLMLDK